MSQSHYRELNTARLVLLGDDMRKRVARRNELAAAPRERERYKKLLGSLKRIKPGPRTYYRIPEYNPFGSQLGSPKAPVLQHLGAERN